MSGSDEKFKGVPAGVELFCRLLSEAILLVICRSLNLASLRAFVESLEEL